MNTSASTPRRPADNVKDRAAYAAEHSWTQLVFRMTQTGEHLTHSESYMYALDQLFSCILRADGVATAATR